MTIDLILVPQGAEYNAVIRGLEGVSSRSNHRCVPTVYPLPIGQAVTTALQSLFPKGSELDGKFILLMGLGGSLSARYQVGDVMLLHSVCKGGADPKKRNSPAHSDPKHRLPTWDIITPLVQHFYSELQNLTVHQTVCESHTASSVGTASNVGVSNVDTVSADMVQGVTLDRMVTSPDEKNELRRIYQADVVDMESAYVVEFLQSRGATVGVIRVVSDDSDTDIPDLSPAIDATGSLNGFKMAWQFLNQPIAAMRLIRGSLKGLKQLSHISAYCASIQPPKTDPFPKSEMF